MRLLKNKIIKITEEQLKAYCGNDATKLLLKEDVDIKSIELFDINKISKEEAAAQYVDYTTMEPVGFTKTVQESQLL